MVLGKFSSSTSPSSGLIKTGLKPSLNVTLNLLK